MNDLSSVEAHQAQEEEKEGRQEVERRRQEAGDVRIMGLMKEIHIELHNTSNLIKWLEERITILEKKQETLE